MAVASRANSDYGRFLDEVKDLSLFPLWERVGKLAPGTACVPAHWRYDSIRPQLLRACNLVTKKEASRRVLCLENPSLRGTTFVAPSLFAGLQIIMPGEIAPSHRHSPSALRFIVEGESMALYGASLVPDEFHADGHATPVLIYPYARTQAALDILEKAGRPHPAHGYRLRYANPANGRHPFPTMAVSMQRLPAGFAGARYRATGSAVFCVHKGKGTAQLGEERVALSPHDVFVVPPWVPYSFGADSELELFSYSDRAAQEALGYWREELG